MFTIQIQVILKVHVSLKIKLKKRPFKHLEKVVVHRKVRINKEYLRNGSFFIGYFSYLSEQLIGLSSKFEIKLE